MAGIGWTRWRMRAAWGRALAVNAVSTIVKDHRGTIAARDQDTNTQLTVVTASAALFVDRCGNKRSRT